MRRVLGLVVMILLVGWAGIGEARERALEELPKDVWNLALIWTEPIKQIAKETRRFDPISGLWFGLIEGSVKSFERTTDFFLPRKGEASSHSLAPSKKGLLNYSF